MTKNKIMDDPFNPYIDNEGKPLNKPLYFPKYIKKHFIFSPEILSKILKEVEKGDYHTIGEYIGSDGKSEMHAFLVIEIIPTEIQDKYLVVSEDYGQIQ